MSSALQRWPQTVPGTQEPHGQYLLGKRGYLQEQVTAMAKDGGAMFTLRGLGHVQAHSPELGLLFTLKMENQSQRT